MALTILVVDDDEEIAELVKLALRKTEHRVRHVPDAETALGEIADAEPDLLFVDITMPGMGGWALVEQLRKDVDLRGIPIVMLTASDELVDRRVKSTLYGVEGYLTKPFTMDAIREAVTKHASGQ